MLTCSNHNNYNTSSPYYVIICNTFFAIQRLNQPHSTECNNAQYFVNFDKWRVKAGSKNTVFWNIRFVYALELKHAMVFRQNLLNIACNNNIIITTCRKKCIVWGLTWYVPIRPCARGPTHSWRTSVRERHIAFLPIADIVASYVWVSELLLPGTARETLYLNSSFVCVRNIIYIQLLLLAGWYLHEYYYINHACV